LLITILYCVGTNCTYICINLLANPYSYVLYCFLSQIQPLASRDSYVRRWLSYFTVIDIYVHHMGKIKTEFKNKELHSYTEPLVMKRLAM